MMIHRYDILYWSQYDSLARRASNPPVAEFIIFSYLDLHLALFSAHRSFSLDFSSFWLLCSLAPENAHLFRDGRACSLFSWVFTLISWQNTIIILASKCTECQKCQKWCSCVHVEKSCSKSRNLSNEHLSAFFRGCQFILIHTCTCKKPLDRQCSSNVH